MRRKIVSSMVFLFALLGVSMAVAAGDFALAQEEPPEPAARPTLADSTLPDSEFPKILAALGGIKTPDLSALRAALNASDGSQAAGQSVSPAVTALKDLGGNGSPEALLQWPLPDVAAPEVAPAPDSRPASGLYLLSWDGSKWLASRLLTGVDEFKFEVIHPGPPVGHALAIVVTDQVALATYPVIFGVRDHAAALLWDGEADDSRYEPLLQATVGFLDHKGAPTQMLVTGRADPGFLQVAREGKRGFTARAFYRWEGNGFVPERTEYAPGPDYTLYRFISALHLHDYAAAYALVVPGKFMKTDAPSLDKFRPFIQEHWPEFLANEIFTAPEITGGSPEVPSGSPEEHLFLLEKPDRRLLYHPAFSHDGKFRLTGLTRSVPSL